MTTVGFPREVASKEALARFAAPAGVTATVAAATIYVANNSPHTNKLSFGCIMLNSVGLYCPGCGGTRAVYDITQGDFAGALGMNAFVVLVFLPLAVVGIAYWWARAAGMNVPAFNPPSWAIWSFVGLTGAFWIARNLPPLVSYLSPLTA